MSQSNYREIDSLLFKVLENCSTDKEIEQLKQWFATDPEAINYYCDFVKNYTAVLTKYNDELELSGGLDGKLPAELIGLEELAVQEKNSPALELSFPEEIVGLEPVKKARAKRSNKSLLTIAISTLAAIFIIALNVYINKVTPYEIGNVTDVLNAEFSGEMAFKPGDRLVSSRTVHLTNGVVKFATDSGVNIVLEAPAEFRFMNSGEVSVRYGKLFAQVSEQGYGFTVVTPNSRVVDQGTEFGVISQIDGNTEVYMYNGKALLYAGAEKNAVVSRLLTEGMAGKVDRNQKLRAIPMEDDAVVRDFSSDSNLLWRGQNMDLADIVGGGNGFGSGKLDAGINVETGKPIYELVRDGVTYGVAGYKPVVDNKYVDGVFIPGFSAGPVPISSDSSIMATFKENSKCYWGYIVNGAYHKSFDVPKHRFVLNGEVFGTKDNSSLGMHANQGITFDLSAIRRDLPGVKIKSFRALTGISETATKYMLEIKREERAAVEFKVYLDGEKVHDARMTNSDEAGEVEIPIEPQSKYLTLAVTESDWTVAYAWGMFGRPELVLELAERE
ncbi:MAG: NPCBM/NEW2 domain-containing protein [Sedimentisphaerales bacterium]|nr:NPCBM/NEW2 domain-containing protein [Sedimentisphaerales bacterium]